MKKMTWLSVGLLTASLACAQERPARQAAQELTLADVPAAVRDTLTARLPALEAAQVTRRTRPQAEGGEAVTTYMIRGKVGTADASAAINADGTLVYLDEPVAAGDVPANVLGAVKLAVAPPDFAATGGRRLSGRNDRFEVTGTGGGLSYRFTLDAEGNIVELRARRTADETAEGEATDDRGRFGRGEGAPGAMFQRRPGAGADGGQIRRGGADGERRRGDGDRRRPGGDAPADPRAETGDTL